jgi:arginase
MPFGRGGSPATQSGVAVARQIEVIGAAWGLGGADPGCAEAPVVLAPLLATRLQRCGAAALSGPMLRAEPAERRRQQAVSKLCGQLAAAVANAIRQGRLPCVIGGDHSCAGGTWAGVARTLRGELGLVWVDAHMDSHTPATSHTGRLHGMPLAWLLGEDDDPLYGLAAGVVDPRRVALIGVRSFEPEEEARLDALGVRVFHIAEVQKRGLDAVFTDALAIATTGTEGFGISVDLDVVTPDDAPGVGTPEPGGIAGAQLAQALRRIGGRADLLGVELVEYLPRLDPDGRSARVAIDALAAALCGPRDDAQIPADAVQRENP